MALKLLPIYCQIFYIFWRTSVGPLALIRNLTNSVLNFGRCPRITFPMRRFSRGHCRAGCSLASNEEKKETYNQD